MHRLERHHPVLHEVGAPYEDDLRRGALEHLLAGVIGTDLALRILVSIVSRVCSPYSVE
jgi:hypothetical protein